MKNKTSRECWTILTPDSDIDRYVPMKRQGKRSNKKHLSKKKAFRKIIYKQDVWRVYKHKGKDKDYEAYKEWFGKQYNPHKPLRSLSFLNGNRRL